MSSEFWITIGTSLVVIAIAWGELRTKVFGNSGNIKELWDKKADAENLRDLRIKVDGIDKWTRDHEVEANKYRLKTSEDFASIQKEIEIAMRNHDELVRVANRLEQAIEKMDFKFGELTQKMTDALSRRRESDGNK